MSSRRPPLAAIALCFLALPSAGHGGVFVAPAGPPVAGPATGPASPSTPGLGGPGAPGPAGASPSTPGGGLFGPDLSTWSLWWGHNKAPYLALKSHVRSPGTETGSDGWSLGGGAKAARDLRPTEQQVRERIVPALFRTLAKETNNDLVTGTLVALAKIGDDGTLADALRFEAAIERLLSDKNQEIRETAAVALGILANPRSIPALANLLWDTEQGRELVGKTEVDYRTRSFAAYGLGLIGARSGSEVERQVIVAALRRAFEMDETSTRDLAVACLVALSIVPLSTIEPAGALAASPASPTSNRDEPGSGPPESSRLAQLDYVLAVLRDGDRHVLVRSQVPIALARLLDGLPADRREPLRERVAGELVELVERNRDLPELIQSSVLALGGVGTSDGTRPLDARIRRALAAVPKEVPEPQARGFALIAMARVGTNPGSQEEERGIEQASDFLVAQMLSGKNAVRSWAGLACGVLGHELALSGAAPATLERLRRGVRSVLAEERNPSDLGAYAIAAGLLGDQESAPLLLKKLDKSLPDDARGHVALSLSLMDAREAIEPLRGIVEGARYRPELLRDCAIALAILGDKSAVPLLVELLREARGLAAQASLSSALGFIGDQRSIDPLLAVLESPLLTDRARAFAAVALGNAADKEDLPWNSKLALGLNYRAATATLTDPLTGTGILDIL